jgi:hypothetical protein
MPRRTVIVARCSFWKSLASAGFCWQLPLWERILKAGFAF